MAADLRKGHDAKPGLLIVDDDRLIVDTLAFALDADFEVHACDSRADAVDLLRQLPAPPELALVDLGLPPMPHAPDEGFHLIAELLAHSPSMKIFVLSGQNDAADARHARALGAAEFIAKPCDSDALKRLLVRALELQAAEIRRGSEGPEGLIGASPALAKLKSQLAQFADPLFPVLIEGESGSGKEIVARSLHSGSRRAARPFLALNCAAIAPTLVEPTLFGYAKGAFTGALASRPGYFEEANDGTLFLDEIGELPLDMQAKLLRVLENGEYQRVGETQSRVSKARIVTATNRDLRREVRQGAFRADLYHRLSVLTLSVPALREMDSDKLLLLEHFRLFYAAQSGTQPFSLNAEAEKRWLAYPFPGNVRELRNIVIRLGARYAGQRLSPLELEPEFDAGVKTTAPSAPDLQKGMLDRADLVEQATRALENVRHFDLDAMLSAIEHAYLEAATRITRGNISQAAKLLGVNRTTLYSRIATVSVPGEAQNPEALPDESQGPGSQGKR